MKQYTEQEISRMSDAEYFAWKGNQEEMAKEWAELDIDGEGAKLAFDWTDEFDCNSFD